MINGKPSDPSRETLVEPKLAPPVHGDEVTEPLMGKLVSHNVGDPVAVAVGRCGGIEEHSGSPRRISTKFGLSNRLTLTCR
jgi:hypothetical protein